MKSSEQILFRPQSAPSGGLCGLASLYLALSSTVLSISQLSQLNYTGMRETIANETLIQDISVLSDTQLLKQFYACK